MSDQRWMASTPRSTHRRASVPAVSAAAGPPARKANHVVNPTVTDDTNEITARPAVVWRAIGQRRKNHKGAAPSGTQWHPHPERVVPLSVSKAQVFALVTNKLLRFQSVQQHPLKHQRDQDKASRNQHPGKISVPHHAQFWVQSLDSKPGKFRPGHRPDNLPKATMCNNSPI